MKYFFLLPALFLSLAAHAAVTASLDRDHAAPGETVQLQLLHDGSTDSTPDISALKNDFDVLGSSSGSSLQIINGHTSSQAQVNIVLAPKHAGKIVIPPLKWDGQQTPPLELNVNANGQPDGAPSESPHVFFKTTLNQSKPYVQAAVVLTVRLYAGEPFSQASLDLPASSDVLVRQLGQDKQTDETVNGHSYQVIERKYLLFPQRSGKLTLNGPVLDAQIPDTNNTPFGSDPFMNNVLRSMQGMTTRPLHLTGKSVQLDVQPRPAVATGAQWLPAQNVVLEETWLQTHVHAGEPLTRHLRLVASGLTGEQLPDPATLLTLPDNIKPYPDQPIITDSPDGNTVRGSREQNIALIATQPGHYILPAVELHWWDTLHNTQRVATLPAHTLDILPAVASSASVQPALPPAQTAVPIRTALPVHTEQAKYWPQVSLALFLLWLGTIFVWWYSRRPKILPVKSQTPRIKPDNTFKALKRACRDNDPHAARRELLAWAGIMWPANPPVGLNGLSRLIADDKFKATLRQLDRACYTGDEWQGEILAQSLPEPLPAESEKKQVLPELYS